MIAGVLRELTPRVDQVYVVDDGSEDETAKVAEIEGARVLRHDKNLGIGMALQTGYKAAADDNADVLVQIDADGQHNSSHLEGLIEELNESTDIVIGSRFLEGEPQGYSRVRRWGIRFFSYLASALSGKRIYDITSGYRIYRMKSLLRIPPIRSRHWAVEQTLTAIRLNMTVKEVSIPIPPRKKGSSQFRPDVALKYPLKVTLGILRALRTRSGHLY